MKTEEADRLVRTALHEVAPEADVQNLPAGADLRDELSLDSLDFLQLVERLSAGSGIRIDEDDYPRLSTLGDAVAFLAGRTGQPLDGG